MRLSSVLLTALLCASTSLVGAVTSTTEASTSTLIGTHTKSAPGASEPKACSSAVNQSADKHTTLAQRQPRCCGDCRAPGGKDGCWVIPTNGTPQYCSAC